VEVALAVLPVVPKVHLLVDEVKVMLAAGQALLAILQAVAGVTTPRCTIRHSNMRNGTGRKGSRSIQLG